MKRLKTAVLCLILAFLIIQPVIPASVGAADVDAAASGDRLGIAVKYHSSDMSVDVFWTAIPGASGYGLYLFNNDADGNWFITNSQSVGSDVTTKHYNKHFFDTYAAGGMDYKIRITAYLPEGKSFSEEKEFWTNIPILGKPTGTLLSNGVFTWPKVNNATEYTIHLKDSQGKEASFTSRGYLDGIQDFSYAITPGEYYYVHMCASADGYRSSEWVDTPQVRMRSDLSSISGLYWNGYKLRWSAFGSDSPKYYLKLQLYEKNYDDWYDRGGFISTSNTYYDFYPKLSELPHAPYRVWIYAVPQNGAAPSKVTLSPELIYPLDFVSEAECFIDLPVGGKNPDFTAAPRDSAAYTATVSTWYLNEGSYPQLSQTDTFTKGKTYTVRVRFTANPGYSFADGAVFKINGKNADYVGASTYQASFPATEGDAINVYGTAVSFLNEKDDVTIKLTRMFSTESYSTTVRGNNTSFALVGVKKGTYAYSVSKKNHVTIYGMYTVGVVGPLVVKIHPIGDINGDGRVTMLDHAQANAHAKGVKLLSGYAFNCGDVVGNDDKITISDAARINAHAKGVKSMWE